MMQIGVCMCYGRENSILGYGLLAGVKDLCGSLES